MSEPILLIIYGTLVEVGGIIGYRKAGSRPSLIAGVLSGAILTISGIMVLLGVEMGSYIGLGVSVALCLIFGVRLAKTKAWMPSGVMLVVSAVVAVVLGLMLAQ